MKVGEVLNGYRIDTPPTNAGGGMSQWSFATKDGHPYFVKMFLAPKFPLPDGPGSEAAKARKREVCLAFERRHLEIANRLDPHEPGGGNLVVACDFFRVDSTYVKVMERVDAVELPPANRLTGHQLIVILRTLVFSLRLLHSKDIVHGDLKPDNVLAKQTAEGMFISKLIDFDEAYVVGEPPAPEHIVGDPVFYPPELLRYIKQDETLPIDALGTAADIFSLGMLLHSLLVGDVPGFDRSSVKYPAEAILTGQELDVSGAPSLIQPLLTEMLLVNPKDRPAIGDVIDFLAEVDADRLIPTAPPRLRERPKPSVTPPASPTAPAGASSSPAASRSSGSAPGGGGLKGSLGAGRPAAPARPHPGAAPVAPAASERPPAAPSRKPTAPEDGGDAKLRISMGRKRPPSPS